MRNRCHFSPDRTYRYTLAHRWEFPAMDGETLAVVGLNPSTADEQQLDPTLRRVQGFGQEWGYGQFIMLNLFAYRATQPRVMMRAEDPVGPLNDAWIQVVCEDDLDTVLVAWGRGGTYRNRDKEVLDLLRQLDVTVLALDLNLDGTPIHPLYVPKDVEPFEYKGRR